MKHGVVGIRGVETGLYLCMSGDGLAYGAVRSPVCTAHSSDTAWFKGTVYQIQTMLFMINSPHSTLSTGLHNGTKTHSDDLKCLFQVQFSDGCLLKENLEENHYTTYSSLAHPSIYLALSHKGELRKGNSVGRHQSCTHFLPRRTMWSGATNSQLFQDCEKRLYTATGPKQTTKNSPTTTDTVVGIIWNFTYCK